MGCIRRFAPLLALLLPLALLQPALARTQPDARVLIPDVRVLIDVSGSMRHTDPANLRRPALELLVQLLPDDARAGVWTFGHQVTPLVAHGATTSAWKVGARALSRRIGSGERLTDIPTALAAASSDPFDPGRQRSIILLTDGKVDIGDNAVTNLAARRRVLEEQLPALRANGVKIHTIALSPEADRELMERLAVDSGGLFAIAETPEALNRVFLKVLDAAAPAEQLPIVENHFRVDAAIDELTVLVFHGGDQPVRLRSPSKNLTAHSGGDDLRWFRGQGYDLITVRKPEAGEWRIDATLEEGSRVTIVSDLSLASQRLPANLFVQAPAEVDAAAAAALRERGEPLQQPELLKLVEFGATLLRGEDGRRWQLAMAAGDDGWHRAALPMLAEAGTYELAIEADGKTFQRSQRQTVVVREAFEVRSQPAELAPMRLLTLAARDPAIDGLASDVSALIVAPDGTEQRRQLISGDGRTWPVEIEPPASGAVQITFDVAGRYRQGGAFSYRSGTVTLNAAGGTVVAAAPPPQPVVPVEVAPAPTAPEPDVDEAAPPEVAQAAPAGQRWLLYAGVALGNLLLIGLGYFAWRRIMGGGKSEVANKSADEAEEPASPPEGRSLPSLDDLDLPVEAIDIDPAADRRK